MARFLAGLALGLALGTAVAVSQASPEQVAAAAEEAGVDPQDLAGAVNSTGLEPHEYLRMTGELRPPAPTSPSFTVWDRLAACESTSRWNVATGNGYSGGLQFDAVTWRRHGGLDFAPAAYLATRAQQIAIAERTLAAQGWGAWPVCSRVIGAR